MRKMVKEINVVGEFNATLENKFNKDIKELQKGDTIYVFSDGYVYQFGGPDGKKFKSNQLKTMLLNLSGVPMSQQQIALEKSIDEWRGVLQQVDDILVMGVRV